MDLYGPVAKTNRYGGWELSALSFVTNLNVKTNGIEEGDSEAGYSRRGHGHDRSREA